MKLLDLIILRFLNVEFNVHYSDEYICKNFKAKNFQDFLALGFTPEEMLLIDCYGKETDLVWVDFIGMPNSKNLLIYTKVTGLIYNNLELTDKFQFIDVGNFIKHQKQLWGV